MLESNVVLRCREIRADDLESVIALLARGFHSNRKFRDYSSCVNFWRAVASRLEMLPTPASLPKYGVCLDAGDRLVGVVLLSFIVVEGQLRCNVSSWYVEPEFRVYASILSSYATRHKEATFFNLTPAPHTWGILESQGFVAYASGRVIAMPTLCRPIRNVRMSVFTEDVCPGPDLSQSEVDVLRDHAAWGCISLLCEYDDKRHPFVFKVRSAGTFVPLGRLIYCRSLDSFVRFAGAIGRYLLRRGCPLVISDADGLLAHVPSIYLKGARRYWKGPKPMRLGDMAYSEIVWL